jgi:hypothetical protein
MDTLLNLKDLANDLVKKYQSLFTGEEIQLPNEFKQRVKSIYSNSIEYQKYSAIVSTKGVQKGVLNIYLPNQWFYIASFFTAYYNELQKYKQIATEIFSTERLKTLKGGSLSSDEKKRLNKRLSADNSSLIEKFVTDYDWWGGGKTIDRTDFFVSPILNYARLVNATQSYVADLCAFLAENDDLVSILYNTISEQENVSSQTLSIGIDILKDHPLQQIFYGAPGTGKSHRIKEIIQEHGIDEKEQVIRTTFHPDSDYSTFVGCYKPIMKSVPQTYVVEGNEKPVMVNKDTQATKEEIVYNYTPQAFVQAYTKAWANPGKPIILVIEEINRGNCAQIFGDIFQLLDRGDDGVSDYEIKPDKALEDYLKGYFAGKNDVPEDIRNGEIMKLPANLYIWATMNTSDQSLFPIDSAFKRRWEWKYLPINNHEDKNYKIEIGSTKYDWWGFLSKINDVIGNTTSSEDKKLGYFFAKANENGFVTAEQFVGKVLFYLWNDVFKNYGFDNQIFDKGDKKKFDFSDFFKQDGSPNTDMVNKFLGKLDETIDKENTFVEKPKDDKGQEEPSDTEA